MTNRHCILLFGMPRSGTTWLGKLFDAQRQTYYLHEPDSVMPNMAIPLLLKADEVEQYPLASQLELWFACQAEKVIASRPFFAKDYLNLLSWLLFLGSAYVAKVSGRLGAPRFIKPLRLQSDQQRIVWKSIESLGRIAAIKKLVSARSIHILRHPCGHIASTLKGQDAGLFDGGMPIWEDWDLYSKLLQQSGEQRFNIDSLKQMTKEERLAVRWGIINDFALAQCAGDSTNMVLVYENLCKNPLQVLQQCLAFCGLKADQQCQQYLAQSVEGGNNSAYYSTTKDPLQSAYKWRKQLPDDVQQRINNIVLQFNSGRYYRDDF